MFWLHVSQQNEIEHETKWQKMKVSIFLVPTKTSLVSNSCQINAPGEQAKVFS